MFPVVEVDSSRAEFLEPMGAKRKFWYRESNNRWYLFKAEDRGTGEDWAEKISCELSELLGLPHVHYELAWDPSKQVPGVVCASCVEPPYELLLGNELLAEFNPAYPAKEARYYKQSAHTVKAVVSALERMKRPPVQWTAHMPKGIHTALDVFMGYVTLDTWVANQDRHHENWGALRTGATSYLAPTFDHGAALARNLSDREREKRIITKDTGYAIPAFTARARSAFYNATGAAKPMKTIDAWKAFAAHAPRAAVCWQEQLQGINQQAIRSIIEQVPEGRISTIGRNFCLALLEENRRRLLEELDR